MFFIRTQRSGVHFGTPKVADRRTGVTFPSSSGDNHRSPKACVGVAVTCSASSYVRFRLSSFLRHRAYVEAE